LAYIATICQAGSRSITGVVGDFCRTVSDKFLHIMEYAVFGVLLHRTFSRQPKWIALSQNAVLLAVFIAMVYGATDEFHQSFVPGRSTEVNDWIADSIGASLGVVCSLIFNAIVAKRLQRKSHS